MIGSIENLGSLTGTLSDTGHLEGTMSIPKAIAAIRDYEKLDNKPSIEQVTLIGNKNFEDLGLSAMTADDLLEILV